MINGQRDRIILASKVFFTRDPDEPNSGGLSRRHILAECAKSLKNLRTDWIDLYYLHRPQRGIPLDEPLRALDDLIRSGKVRYIGTSMFPAWLTTEALWTSERLGLNRFIAEQPYYNMVGREIERDVIQFAHRHGIAIMPFSPLNGGILAGRYSRDQLKPEGSRAVFDPWAGYWDADLNDKVFTLIDELKTMADGKGCTMSQLVLAWTMSQPGITSVIMGPRTVDQLEDNLGALAVEISDEDKKRIDELTLPGSSIGAH